MDYNLGTSHMLWLNETNINASQDLINLLQFNVSSCCDKHGIMMMYVRNMTL
jgi:hypothetical protein